MLGFDWAGGKPKLGDLISRTSLPENYYKNTGDKLINLGDLEFFRHNPFCIQSVEIHPNTLSRVERRSLWNYTIGNICNVNCKTMAHEICKNWGLKKVYQVRPRVFIHEEIKPFIRTACINTTGANQGSMSLEVINSIREQFSDYLLIQIGGIHDVDANCDIDRRGISWENSAKIIAESEIIFCVDSFCYWLSKCYPRVHRYVVLVNKDRERCENFWPRGFGNEFINNPFDTWQEMDSSIYVNSFDENYGITISHKNL